jgi:protoporphyrinogen oxidase
MKIAVIGAGPAGITAAYQLSKEIPSGKVSQLDVYEIASEVGGLARSFNLWGQRVDFGPHRFFSNDPRINALWLEVVEKDYDIVNRQTRIFYKNRFFDYPLKASNALRELGLLEAARCVLSYFHQRLFPVKDTGTFESWVTRRFGKRLYRIFFKTYSEKLWGIPCSELDSDFASQRIKKLSLFEAIKNALLQGRNNKHMTLVDQFAYPLNGTGSVYERMAERIRKNGGAVHLSKGIEKVITSGRKVKGIELNSGEYLEYDHVISTMPVSLLVTRLPETPYEIKEFANSLKFRNTILVYLEIDQKNLFTDQWLYVHSGELRMGRVTNFRNWVPQLNGTSDSTILCMEYWCNFDDPQWEMDDQDIIGLAGSEIKKTGLAGNGTIINGKVIRLPRCYPVYFRGYKSVLKPVEEYLSSIQNLQAIGRYGAYKYNNQDHSILMGILAAENIILGKNNDLWLINTDYEVYQESSVITKTGLVTT